MNEHLLLSIAIIATQVVLLVAHIGAAYFVLLQPITWRSFAKLAALSLVSTVLWIFLGLTFFFSYFVCSACYVEFLEDRVAGMTLALPFPITFMFLFLVSLLPALQRRGHSSWSFWIVPLIASFAAYLFGGIALPPDLSMDLTLIALWAAIGLATGLLLSLAATVVKKFSKGSEEFGSVRVLRNSVIGILSAIIGLVTGAWVGQNIAWREERGSHNYQSFSGDIQGSVIIIITGLLVAFLAVILLAVLASVVRPLIKNWRASTPDNLTLNG